MIEHFNRERYERNSGQAVKEVQRRIGHPVTDVKGARSLLAWSQEQLAAAADVSIPTIKRLEAQDGPLGGRDETGSKIRLALETAGVEFLDENGGGPGVRLRERQLKKG